MEVETERDLGNDHLFLLESAYPKIQKATEAFRSEKSRIANRLHGFNPKENRVWFEITKRYGEGIKQQELLSIAQVLSATTNIKLDRDAKRRKSVLIKWFEENWYIIHPYLGFVILEDNQSFY